MQMNMVMIMEGRPTQPPEIGTSSTKEGLNL
jgi:hypothetical protein